MRATDADSLVRATGADSLVKKERRFEKAAYVRISRERRKSEMKSVVA